MKKVILVVIGCLAYVSVQAQSVASAEQVKKVIDTQIQTITSKVEFSDTQKEFLNTYVSYTVKSKTRGFQEEALVVELKDVNMDTFFTEEQRTVIRETLASVLNNNVSFKTPSNTLSTGNPKSQF
ncbi:hypothetical protein [uncultured Dokdonia sp.]|uniref:hypothetical protein n=1 Tax=uncultured Dokdonia sp. TaxID=575653 RepID=UPI00262D5F4D|nr:hypothetical protein [uncultured Dokdonia sp.]